MSAFLSTLNRLRAFFRKRTLDSELDVEMASHLEFAIEENLKRGLSPEEARRQALIRFGGTDSAREEHREVRGFPGLDSILHDFRYAFRQLRKNPGFACTVILTLALGIGANTAIFSVIQALILRSLPVPNPQELLLVSITVNGNTSDSFSYPIVRALAERNDVFAELGGFCGYNFIVGPPDRPLRTPGAFVSGGYFPALQLRPAAGRLLRQEDDQPGARLVAVISDGYWERIFHREMRAVGATVLVDGHPTIIIGVMPPGFTGADVGYIEDLVLPFQARAQLSPDGRGFLQAGNNYIRILARPAQELTPAQVRARLKVLWPQMAAVSVNPKMPAKRREAMLASSLDIVPGRTGWTPLRSKYAKPLYILLAITGLVLLVACANVATLLLARVVTRRREIAIRLAIGASRWRVARQLIVESFILASLGATFGGLLAQFGSTLLLRLVSSSSDALPLAVGMNGQVLAFAVAITVLTVLLFGLAPAFRATSAGPGPALRRSEGNVPLSHGRLGPALVAVQVGLSLLLLIGAGLFLRTLRNLQAVEPGFEHEGVVLLDIDARRDLQVIGPQGDVRLTTFFRDSLDFISRAQGVESVSLSNFTPISGGYWSQAVTINGQRLSDEDVAFFAVSPGYFRTLRIPMLAGRDFTLRDDAGAMPVVIVNQEFVRRFIPGTQALGQVVSAADSHLWQNMEIAGVVANSIPYSLREPPRPSVFVPFFQQPQGRIGFGTFEIRAIGSLTAVSSAVDDVVRPRLPGVPLTVHSFTAQVENSIRSEILMAQLAGFFGALSLILATMGLYGLLAYMVTLRTNEIGIRMALGAPRNQVLWMVLRSALNLVALGIALGLPAAWWASRVVSGMLYGLAPTDAVTIITAVVLLWATGLAAGFLPALRATKVDPMVALRCE